MYDFPQLRPAIFKWWGELFRIFHQHGLSGAPEVLTTEIDDLYGFWLSPDLFFSQTCGYPLTHKLSGKVRMLGTPCYDVPGFEEATYLSYIISKSGSHPYGRVAVNGMDSFSGWIALNRTIDKSQISEVIESGSHASSIDYVREGKADFAAIDCVTYALIGDTEPERLEGLKIVDQSPPAPALPYITSLDRSDADVALMQKCIGLAFESSDLEKTRKKLRLKKFEILPLEIYTHAMNQNK